MLVLDGDLTLINELDGEYGNYIPVVNQNVYTGATEVTPTQQTQVLETADMVVPANITINPIPSNYGLITWNGSTLTVS